MAKRACRNRLNIGCLVSNGFRFLAGPKYDHAKAINSADDLGGLVTSIFVDSRDNVEDSVIEVCKCIALAAAYGINRVYLPGCAWICEGVIAIESIPLVLISVSDVLYDDEFIIWTGDFLRGRGPCLSVDSSGVNVAIDCLKNLCVSKEAGQILQIVENSLPGGDCSLLFPGVGAC